MPSFLQKFRDFFLLAPEEADDPYANAKPAELPPVEILKPEETETAAAPAPAESAEKPAEKPETKPEEIPAEAPEAKPEEIPAEAPEAKPEEIPAEIPEAKPEEIPAEAPEAKPEEIPAEVPEAKPAAPPKRRRQPKKTPVAVPEEVPAAEEPAAPEPEPAVPAPEAALPAETPAEEPADSRSFADKIRAFFFAGDDDGEITLHNSREGKRPVGAKVRMASHRFTTVTGAPDTGRTDCMPLDDSARALLEAAKAVRQNAYAKYSGFKVGAALKGASGQVYFGVNVENASYPAGLCAERAAFAAAITAGERSFQAIAICGGDDSESCFPCGICRQVLMEMCPPSMPVILEKGVYRLDSLLPHSFRL